ncbi:MAG: hypothetical protein EP319_09795 [Deltaproteobacteria bacterium]|nr:MAG: hypothetical protein EP319_09795 [Deltaproteobacteria bacterium]
MRFIIPIFLLIFTTQLEAKPVAGKVQIVKGKVTILKPAAKAATALKKNEEVFEDSSIVTQKGSFAKILLINGSNLTVGPNSKIVVATVQKKDASVINLLTGKLRAKVKPQNRKDFFIKTQTAAMAVRGTDFMAIYNHDSGKSGLLTFEGKVAIKQAKQKIEHEPVQKQVEELKAVMNDDSTAKIVELGGFTTTDKQDAVLDQVRINEQQFARMKLDSSLGAEKLKVSKKVIAKEVVKTKKIFAKMAAENINKNIKSGGLVVQDLSYYVPPTESKAGDEIGRISSNGSYIPPKGLKIDPRKGFVAEDRSKIAQAEQLNKAIEEQIAPPPKADDKNYRRYFDLDAE